MGRRVQATAELVDAKGRVVDQLRHAPLPVVARERRQKEYEARLSFETPVHHQSALRLWRLRAQGMTSGFTWGGKVNDELDVPRGYFGVYWYDRGPTTAAGMEQAIAEFQRTQDFDGLSYLAKKELFKRTGDKRFLVRRPELDDPATLRLLQDVSRSAARAKAVYNMDYYFVGDEGSLGSYADPVDFCFGPHTLARFRGWLRGQYGSLDALNRSWKSAFADWDAVVPLTTDEARTSGRFAPWADHRTYMETSFANAYATVRQAVVEGDPEGRIALSGTQVTTPWNGCDWRRLDQVVDDFLSYSGGNQWEIHRSFAKPGARVGFWTGYGRSGAAVKHEVWSAALSGVLFPNLFWSPSIVNPDLTFSRSAQDLGAAFQALRFEGIGKLLMEAERVPDGVALHYSMPSVHAAGVLGHHARRNDEDAPAPDERDFPGARDGWVRLLQDLGFSPDFVASDQLEGGGLEGRRVFVLPYSLALSDAEVRALRAFVEGGGVLLADGASGLLDEHANWRASGALDELFGIAGPPADQRGRAEARARGAVTVTREGAGLGTDGRRDDGAARARAPAEGDERPGAPAHRRSGRRDRPPDRRRLDRVPEPAARPLRRPARSGRRRRVPRARRARPRPRRRAAGGGRDRRGRPAAAPRARLALPLRRRGRRRGARRRAASRHELRRRRGHALHGAGRSGGGPRRGGSPPGRRSRGERAHGRVARADRHGARAAPARRGARARVEPGAGRRPLALGALGRQARHAPRLRAAGGGGRGGPGQRLVRVHVEGPGGRFLPEYAANLLTDGGGARFVLPSALNDPEGEYRIVATDVLSGARAEAAVVLK